MPGPPIDTGINAVLKAVQENPALAREIIALISQQQQMQQRVRELTLKKRLRMQQQLLLQPFPPPSAGVTLNQPSLPLIGDMGLEEVLESLHVYHDSLYQQHQGNQPALVALENGSKFLKALVTHFWKDGENICGHFANISSYAAACTPAYYRLVCWCQQSLKNIVPGEFDRLPFPLTSYQQKDSLMELKEIILLAPGEPRRSHLAEMYFYALNFDNDSLYGVEGLVQEHWDVTAQARGLGTGYFRNHCILGDVLPLEVTPDQMIEICMRWEIASLVGDVISEVKHLFLPNLATVSCLGSKDEYQHCIRQILDHPKLQDCTKHQRDLPCQPPHPEDAVTLLWSGPSPMDQETVLMLSLLSIASVGVANDLPSLTKREDVNAVFEKTVAIARAVGNSCRRASM